MNGTRGDNTNPNDKPGEAVFNAVASDLRWAVRTVQDEVKYIEDLEVQLVKKKKQLEESRKREEELASFLTIHDAMSIYDALGLEKEKSDETGKR